MIDTPGILHVEAQLAAVIRITIPRAQIREVMGPAIQEVMAAGKAQGVGPAGPWFSHHLRMPSEVFDFEVGVPVTKPVQPTGRVIAGSLPAAKIARTIYRGPYEGLGSAWGELMSWIQKQNLSPAGDLWECYAVGPERSPDPSTWQTELDLPLL